MLLIYVLIFIVGLCIGSFINVLIFRLDRKEGIVGGRSECQDCHKQLLWLDMVPVVSYFLLRGKCRYCKSKISPIYPIVESSVAGALLAYFLVNGISFDWASLYFSFLIILFISLVFFDLLYLILPDKIVFTIGGIGLLCGIIFRTSQLTNLLSSAFIFALGFGILYMVSKGRAMGFGDVKLVFSMGLVLGYPAGLFSIILAIWTAAIWGIILIVTKKASLKTALPFGSFLSLSAVVFIIFTDLINEQIQIYF